MSSADKIFEPHSEKQCDVLFSDKRITIAATGIQWGKTTIGVMRLKMAMHQYTDPTDNFIVTSPTYKILYQSTIPPFLRWNKGIGQYDRKNECFHIHGGGKVWFRTGTDPDSVVGITDVRHVLCDEAGLYSLYFWENIQARSSIKKCPITIVTSPYSLNWLYRDYIRKYKMGDEYTKELVHLCQAKSSENPYFPADEYESKRRTMEPRRFNMMYGGNFDKAQGLVFSCFDASKHWIDPINLPVGTRFYGGIDWGYTHPFVIVVRAVTPLGMHYQVAEFYQTQMMLTDKIDAAYRLKTMYPIEKFIADSANPDDIASFNAAGLRTIPAIKEIKKNIELHWELINSGCYAVFKGDNFKTVDEYEMYHYPEEKDLRPDQSDSDRSELPVDKENHCMDANCYLTRALFTTSKKPNKIIQSDKSDIIPVRIASTYDLNYDKLLKKKNHGGRIL
jgi:phage terminase large subunit